MGPDVSEVYHDDRPDKVRVEFKYETFEFTEDQAINLGLKIIDSARRL